MKLREEQCTVKWYDAEGKNQSKFEKNTDGKVNGWKTSEKIDLSSNPPWKIVNRMEIIHLNSIIMNRMRKWQEKPI